MHGSFAFRIKRVDGMGALKNTVNKKRGRLQFFYFRCVGIGEGENSSYHRPLSQIQNVEDFIPCIASSPINPLLLYNQRSFSSRHSRFIE